MDSATNTPNTSNKRRRWPWLLGILLLAIIGGALLLPKLIDPNQYRAELNKLIGDALGGEVELGTLHWGLGSTIWLQAESLAIKNAELIPINLTVSEDLQIDLLSTPEPGELLLLDRYAKRISKLSWLLTSETVFGALDQGQNPGVFFEFLEHRSQQPPGPAVVDFFAGIESRRMALKDGGGGRLLHCSNTRIVSLLTSDPGTRDHCLKAGAKLLVVPEKAEKGFREGLRKLGYIFPAG